MIWALWWGLFTLAGIWAQSYLPGVDFLAPGFVLSLQEEKISRTVWLGVLWLLLQEGMGSLAFGTTILWYGALASLFYFGHWLFEAKNFVFMIILGLCLGSMHFVLMHVMATLQDWQIAPERVLVECVAQAIAFPLEWGFIYIIYSHLPINDHEI